MMHSGCPKMIDAHTTILPQRGPYRTCMYREKCDNGICAIIPMKAHIWNVFSGTLTYDEQINGEKHEFSSSKTEQIAISELTKYSWKNALTKNTIKDAADRL